MSIRDYLTHVIPLSERRGGPFDHFFLHIIFLYFIFNLVL